MMNIGAQIKKLRRMKKISLTALAQDSGVQIATLSRIENGKMTGTLHSHLMIAKALGLDISELYEGLEETNDMPVVTEETFEAVAEPNEKISREILSRQPSSKRMLPLLIKVQGKTTTEPEKYYPGSERFIWVLEGVLTVHIKEQSIKLAPNASLYFNGSAPHYFENINQGTVKFLSIMTPVSL